MNKMITLGMLGISCLALQTCAGGATGMLGAGSDNRKDILGTIVFSADKQ
jgi:hypothetical protein